MTLTLNRPFVLADYSAGGVSSCSSAIVDVASKAFLLESRVDLFVDERFGRTQITRHFALLRSPSPRPTPLHQP